MPDYVLGKDFYLYYSAAPLTDKTGTSFNALSWTEIDNVRDVTPDFTRDDVDITTRATARTGWKASAGGLADMSFQFEMLYKPGEPGYEAMAAAFFNQSTITLADLDGPIDTGGTTGFAANFSVGNFSRPEPLSEAAKVSVTIKAASMPQRVLVAT